MIDDRTHACVGLQQNDKVRKVANYLFTLITVACDTDKLYSNNALQYLAGETQVITDQA